MKLSWCHLSPCGPWRKSTDLAVRVVDLPAAAVPAEVHEALGPQDLDPHGVERPVGEDVQVADGHRHLLHVGRPEGGFEDQREVAVLEEGELRVGDLPAVLQGSNAAGVGRPSSG